MKSFIQNISRSFVALTLVTAFAGSAALSLATPTFASNHTPADKVQQGVQDVGGTGEGRGEGAFMNLLKDVINLLLFIIGAIAVIMIIIGGIKYTTSNGDQAQVTSAKNTILYAVVGLVVAIMAYAIVNFVLRALN